MQLFDDWLGFTVSRLWLQVYVQHFVSQFHCAKYKTLAFLIGQLVIDHAETYEGPAKCSVTNRLL